MTDQPEFSQLDLQALRFHEAGPVGKRAGKLQVSASKPMATQHDLSLAYSPGVAAPVRAIGHQPELAYKYTNKGNMIAVVSNGSAILGLGNLGPTASKPVMEGKAVLFKRFADIDCVDLEIDVADPEAFIDTVRPLEPGFGGINLEDIKAPDCFVIEERLRAQMNIPVFHDDQHGTAIIVLAGLINALKLTDRDIADTRLVCNGAGAAGIACLDLALALGMRRENIILCDTKGPVYRGRAQGMNRWKERFQSDTNARTLAEAMVGADIFFGLSVKGAIDQDMVRSMADKPIIFAMANPDPEITPQEVAEVRDDAIMATGRSDYPNQINNVLGFPYIFRGALDVQATQINDAMKLAAATALAELAREGLPDGAAAAYDGARPQFGPGYIIPVPFDPRLISRVSAAVAKAAMDSGVARAPIADFDAYRNALSARLDPLAHLLQPIYARLKQTTKRVIFAEGEEEPIVRSASEFFRQGLGLPILIGREEQVRNTCAATGVDLPAEIEIRNARNSENTSQYIDLLYQKLQRSGFLYRDCQRLVHTDRNYFGACMLASGHADAMVTGATRNFTSAVRNVRRVIDDKEGSTAMGISIVVAQDGRIFFVADTAVIDMPTAEEIAGIAKEAARFSTNLQFTPHVGLLAFSTFGTPMGERSDKVRDAVALLDAQAQTGEVDFVYEGDLAADIALNMSKMAAYPFSRLKEPANILVMPAFHSASISTKMLQELGGAHVIGPILLGLEHNVQVLQLGAMDNDIIYMAAIAAAGVEA